MLSEEEKKAIEWLKNKPDECTNIINSSSYIGNKKAYAKERANFKTVFNIITKLQKENEEKDNKVRKIINRLDNDYKRITETKSDGKHWDDYSKCRLKAYRTKTIEIKEYIEKEYFETKTKKGE